MNPLAQSLIALRPQCVATLTELRGNLRGLRTAVVSSADGLVIGAVEESPGIARRVAAMAAALGGLSQSVARELNSGALHGTVIECSEGIVFCRMVGGAGMQLALLALVSSSENYGLALWAVKGAASRLEAELTATAV
jgi:predicted regulator of Ras-like GTPase activity (Roadblock/LC7/MglB family)